MNKKVLWHQVLRLYDLSHFVDDTGIYAVCHNCCVRVNGDADWHSFPHRFECVETKDHLLTMKKNEKDQN